MFLSRLKQDAPSHIDESCINLPIANIDAESFQINGAEASFLVTYLVGKAGGESLRVNSRVRFTANRDFAVPGLGPAGKGRHARYKELVVEGLQTYESIYTKKERVAIPRCLFPAPYTPAIPSNVVLLRVPAQLDDELQPLVRYMNGVPPRDEDSFSRMLYLSASTITTAGFGDIVPLTKPARLAVTMESILGVLLAGLFLNAVARNKS